MWKQTFHALVGILAVAGAVLLSSGPLSAQTEVEIISASEHGTTLRFRDDDGVLVERFDGARRTVDDFFDEHGNVERMVTRYPDGRSVTERLAYGQRSADGGERFPLARGRNMSRERMDGFLSRLPPLPGTSPRTELALRRGRPRPVDGAAPDPAHPWGHHWKERDDGGARTVFRLLHQEMEVESARLGEKRLDEEWLRITDSRGGLRHDRLAETARLEQDCDGPWACDTAPLPAVASYDAVGRIAHVVTNDEGYPTETWYGETLVARYHYAHVDGVRPLPPHGGLGDFWVELIDAGTGKRLLDSRTLPTTSARPLFSAGGTTIKSGLIESVDDELFAVVNHDIFVGRYALLPLGEGPVWRTVLATGTEAPEMDSVVHYTEDRLRIEFQFDHTDLVVEAPRRGASPIKVTWPKDISLPFGAGEEVGALMAPRQPRPFPPEEGRIPPP
ncbi:MAG: hypothetical protein OXI49_15745 [Acidobacteriota bacterium]|nr:hypothetical protein [Acidobacteriota bacterium]